MPKGRKRLPTEVKQMAGTMKHCRVNENEPDYVLPAEIPDPPVYLSKVGRDVYYTTAKELLDLGILSRVSLPLFVMYVIQVSIHYDAMEAIHKEGVRIKDRYDEWKINPLVRIANDSLMATVRIACEFGITPASASKVKATKKELNPKSKIMELLNKPK